MRGRGAVTGDGGSAQSSPKRATLGECRGVGLGKLVQGPFAHRCRRQPRGGGRTRGAGGKGKGKVEKAPPNGPYLSSQR